MATVYFRGRKQEAKRIAARLVRILTGQEADPLGIAKGVFLTIGFAALSSIKEDFVRKARGGTGEDGHTWPPLSPETIARRRVGAKDRKENDEIRKREAWVKREAKKLLPRYLLSMSPERAKSEAKRVAELRRTKATGRTKVNVFGGRSVEMLRDTGILFNSLSPGSLSSPGPGATYHPPTLPGGSEQVLEAISNGVIVGTNVPYAATHQYGDSDRNIPARPFLPDPDNIPEQWQEDWLEASEQALLAGARMAFEMSQ